MSRSERYLPRHARRSLAPRGQRGPSGPRHASPLTGFRRWRNRHDRSAPGLRRRWRRAGLAGRLARVTGWALLLAGSVLVFLLAWQFIGDTVSADSTTRPPGVQAPGPGR